MAPVIPPARTVARHRPPSGVAAPAAQNDALPGGEKQAAGSERPGASGGAAPLAADSRPLPSEPSPLPSRLPHLPAVVRVVRGFPVLQRLRALLPRTAILAVLPGRRAGGADVARGTLGAGAVEPLGGFRAHPRRGTGRAVVAVHDRPLQPPVRAARAGAGSLAAAGARRADYSRAAARAAPHPPPIHHD